LVLCALHVTTRAQRNARRPSLRNSATRSQAVLAIARDDAHDVVGDGSSDRRHETRELQKKKKAAVNDVV
jgi:hypothetical protein